MTAGDELSIMDGIIQHEKEKEDVSSLRPKPGSLLGNLQEREPAEKGATQHSSGGDGDSNTSFAATLAGSNILRFTVPKGSSTVTLRKKRGRPRGHVRSRQRAAAAQPRAASRNVSAEGAVGTGDRGGEGSGVSERCQACGVKERADAILLCDGCDAEVCLHCAGWSSPSVCPTFVCHDCITFVRRHRLSQESLLSPSTSASVRSPFLPAADVLDARNQVKKQMENSSETYKLPPLSSAATNSSVNSTGASKIVDIEACSENWTPASSASSASSSMTGAIQQCLSPQWTDPLDFLLDPQAYDGMASTSAPYQTFVFEDGNCAKEDFVWMRTIMEIDQENRLKKKKSVKTDDASRPEGMNPQETRSSDVMEHSYKNESLQGRTSEDILAEGCERSETCVAVAPIAETGNDIAADDRENDGSDEVSDKQVPVEMPITGKVYVDGVELPELMESPSSACTLSNISSSSSQSTLSMMSASSSLSFSKDDIVKEEYEPKKTKKTKKRKKERGEMGLYQEDGKKSAMKAEDETSKSRKKRKKKKTKKRKYNANKAQLQLQLLPSSEIALPTTDSNKSMSLQLLAHVDLESKRCLRAMLETMHTVLERYERGTLVALDKLRDAVLEECVRRRKRCQRTGSCVVEYADMAAAAKDEAAFDKALMLLQTKNMP